MSRHISLWVVLLAVFLVTAGCKKQEALAPPTVVAANAEEEFMRLMNSGKNYLDKGSAEQALAAYEQAVKLQPAHPDVLLNLANTHLLAGRAEQALPFALKAVELDPNSAAANFVAGCARNRLGQFEEAVKVLQVSKEMDPSVAATAFQLGQAHFQLKHWPEAAAEFQAVVELEPEHASAHYNLGQALIRAGRAEEAQKELEAHQQLAAKTAGGPPPNAAMFEKSKHTLARLPFQLEQPARNGIKVAFSDQTAAFFGAAAGKYAGPVGVMDINHRGAADLFVLEPGQGFRVLLNTNNAFQPLGEAWPANASNRYVKTLVADLQNDRFEDVLVLGERGSHVFRFATNGVFTEASAFSRLQGLAAVDGALVDLDFTGKLDLIAVTAVTNDVRVFRNLGNLLFRDITATSGVPAGITAARQVVVDDWNHDDIMDAAIAQADGKLLHLTKLRGGPLAPTNSAAWPAGTVLASGDLNNDLRTDVAVINGKKLEIAFDGIEERRGVETGVVKSMQLIDYDNDGWLDIITTGATVRAWRNVGREGFVETTAELGLGQWAGVASLHAADFDGDGDTDLLAALEQGGLKLLRNDGANANHQLKVRLMGNRSNASGLGVKLELQAGGLRTLRTVTHLPVEIGTGKYGQIETFTVRWFDLAVPSVDLKIEPTNIVLAELVLPTGSCPYLYVWDGVKHRFVTDLLGAAPLGLPVAEGRYIQADPDEFVLIGDESNFQPLNGAYQVQITEELREVLYLDEAKLVVVDHPPGTEVYSTDKLVPGAPFPPSGLITLHERKALRQARTLAGAEVTAALQESDRVMVSPARLHVPQRRGMAEPHGVELDFGPLPVEKPLALALTGWLRFGGGMANMANSHDASLPFPFPVLEAEVGGEWQPVRVTVGAPAGKTKTIVVDLDGLLPTGAQRLRITAGFEIHWDRIALFEKAGEAGTRVTTLAAGSSDLHWRGFSEFEELPWTQPLTPDYLRVQPEPKWRITPSGWVTRYGAVDALIARRDNALALISGGDELTLRFAANTVPAKTAGMTRHFFLYTDGWDKDADFHVRAGTTVEPLPFHGMDDQQYGTQERPASINDRWIEQWNTRWIPGQTFKRAARR